MMRSGFRAMGTTVDVIAESKQGLEDTRALFQAMESRFSRFRATSELSAINTDPRASLAVSRPMAEILRSAADLMAATDGSFDPSTGRAVIEWGYDRSIEDICDLDDQPRAARFGGWSIEGGVLTKDEGIVLDLGGIAKGWTADRAVELGMACLVSAGGDMRSAIDGTVVEIVDPWDAVPARVALGHGGLATSSTSKRRWQVAGREAHHLIDPATGAPAASPVLSATAICSTAVEAEAAAKTLILRGAESLVWAQQQEWIRSAMVTWQDGSVYATAGIELAA